VGGDLTVTIELRNLTPAFGAEVVGLDAGAPLGDADAQRLRAAFDERGLLLFRGLHDLPTTYQASLASTVLGLVDAGYTGSTDDDGGYFVSNKRPGGGAPYGRLLFHSDMMWGDNPFQVLSLYGLEVEQPSVPTSFVSSADAWDTLPEGLRVRVGDHDAIHSTGQQMRADEADGELLQPQRERVQTARKPIAWTHPRTGRTLLYVSQMMTREIDELAPDESEALLGELFAHLYATDRVWRHDWHQGDLVLWDNLAIQHARSDVRVDGPVRTLRKVIAPKHALADRPEAPTFAKVGGR
jgi:alpha-ketoglutarate-dependent taurine dioxygenase